MRILKASAALALALTWSASISAQVPSAEERERLKQAKQWFDEGVRAEQSGDCDTAVEKFMLALEVKETPQLNLRIGLCLEKLGQLLGAREAYQTALELPIDNAKLRATLQAQLEQIEPRLASLTLTLPKPVPGLDLRIDGVRAAVGEAVQVDPGTRQIRAQAAGHRSFEQEATLAEGEALEITILMPKLASGEPEPVEAPKAPEPTQASGPGVVPWLFVGGGAVALGVGIGMFVAAGGPLGDAEALCGGNRDFCRADAASRSRIDDLVSEANTFEGLGMGFTLAGVGLAATGIVMMLLPDGTDAPTEGDQARFELRPWVSPLGGGLGLGASF